MKTGQAIEIATGTDLEVVKGHVARVTKGEIVIDLDRPRGSFAPETPLALHYDDPVGHHQLAARVIGMQGPGRLVLWPATEPERPAELKTGDARSRIRVEHLLRMEYEVIARDELPRVQEDVLHGPRILKYERPRRELLQAAGAEHELLGEDLADSPIWAAIQRLEQKMDLVLERLGAEPPASDERPFTNVSLSARGLRFRDFERRCRAGDLVLLTIELPLNPTLEISAIAETLYVVEDVRHPQLSVGQDVVLEFRVIQEEAQEEIERYCRMMQGAQRPR